MSVAQETLTILDVNLYTRHANIFTISLLITAHPHLYGITGRGGKLPVEPWRVVE